MVETDPIAPVFVADARCPQCGRVTDVLVEEVPLTLYCGACEYKWINLANLPEGA